MESGDRGPSGRRRFPRSARRYVSFGAIDTTRMLGHLPAPPGLRATAARLGGREIVVLSLPIGPAPADGDGLTPAEAMEANPANRVGLCK
jgi:hypothetical protein